MQAYLALCRRYVALQADLTPPGLIAWGEGVLRILANALASKGLILRYRLQLADQRETQV